MSHCPVCHRFFSRRFMCTEHLEKEHSDWLEANRYTPSQGSWLGDHDSLQGRCTCCPTCKEVTDWCDKTGKPYRISKNPACRARVAAQAEKNLANAGMDRHTIMTDMEHQRDMLRKRRTSGIYRFETDGGKVEYSSQLEKNWLMFCDKVLELPSFSIQDPPKSFKYHDPKDNIDRWYAPDYYLPDYNLLVEIKDGGDKPNTNPAYLEETRYKVYLKDEVMKAQNEFNFIRISGKNYGAFLETLFNIVQQDLTDPPKNGDKHKTLCVITENAIRVGEDDIPPIDFEQINPETISFFVKYVEDTDMAQFWGITDSLYQSYWVASDPESQEMYKLSKEELVSIPGELHIYSYRGDPNKIRNAYLGMMAIFHEDHASPLWDILEILKANNIHFDDRRNLNNNPNRKCDFVLMSISTYAREETDEN